MKQFHSLTFKLFIKYAIHVTCKHTLPVTDVCENVNFLQKFCFIAICYYIFFCVAYLHTAHSVFRKSLITENASSTTIIFIFFLQNENSLAFSSFTLCKVFVFESHLIPVQLSVAFCLPLTHASPWMFWILPAEFQIIYYSAMASMLFDQYQCFSHQTYKL